MSPSNSNNVTKAELKNEIKETRELIESIKSMGADVESAEVIISQAENALKANNLDLTKALIESTIQTFALIKQQYFVQAASILFSSLQRSIMGLEGAGSEVEYVKDLYHKAKEKFDSGQYEEAMEYIKSAEDMANNLKANLPEEVIYSHNDEEGAAGGVEGVDYEGSQEQMEKVSRVLIRVEKLLQEAMEEGYSVNEAEKLYSLAEDAFDYQDYKKAEDYAMQSERTLKEILEPLHDERQQKKIKDKEPPEELGGGYMKKREDIPSGDSFAKSDAYYSDIMPKGILGDAPRLIEEKDITTGNELISAEAEEIDSELKIEKEATNLLITADEKITAAKDSGLNIPMAERLLTIGESYFDRGEFDRVKEYAEKAIRQIDEIAARKGITKEVEAKIAAGAQEKNSLAATETVEPAEEELVVEPKVEEVEFIEEPEEEEVGEITIKEEELAKKTEKPESISPNKLKNELLDIKDEIIEASDIELSVDEADDLINEAIKQFNEKDYTEANELGKKAKNKIKKIKKKFIKKKALEMIKYAWKAIEEAEDNGEDTSEASKLLQDARDHVKLGNFEKAVSLAMQSIQLLKEE